MLLVLGGYSIKIIINMLCVSMITLSSNQLLQDENKALRLKDDIRRDISAPLSSIGSNDLSSG